MATQTYMTAKLNLADGTIVYPQISLDNIVRSISDPTLVTVAELSGGKVPIAQLPTTISVTDSNTTVPTTGAVYGALNTKQNTLVEGDNIIHIVNGSTIMADITNLDVAGIDQTATNGVHLVLDGNTVSAAADLAANDSAGVIAGASDGVKLVDGVAQLDVATAPVADGVTAGLVKTVGDGLLVEGGTACIDDATVETTLQDVRIDDGSTVTPVSDQVVTPGNLRGALSVGQAVDVSCKALLCGWSEIQYADDDTWYSTTTEAFTKDSTKFLGTFKLRTTGSNQYYRFGFGTSGSTGSLFPKRAAGLKYLFICDVRNSSTTTAWGAYSLMQADGSPYPNNNSVNGIPYTVPVANCSPNGSFVRMAILVSGDAGYMNLAIQGGGVSATFEIEIKNWRQYEVTALTDDAIAYIAQLPDPDAFFRSTDAYSIRDKYLIKQDMVSPFIPIINMSNSDLTIAAGLAYKMQITDSNTHKFTVDTIPTNGYGWDSHLQLFVNDVATVTFQNPLVLMNPLTPNSGHNITIKWRAGQALAYVEDTDVGYVVTVTAGTENGSLYYGLTNDVGGYVVFADSVDDQTISLIEGTTISRNVNIIGNGMETTVIDGDIYSQGNSVGITNLTLTGSSIGLCRVWNDYTGDIVSISNCKIENCVGSYPGPNGYLGYYNVGLDNCIVVGCGGESHGTLFALLDKDVTNTIFTDCSMSGGTQWQVGRTVYCFGKKGCSISGCTFSNNKAYYGDVSVYNSATWTIENCLFEPLSVSSWNCGVVVQAGADQAGAGYATITGCTFNNNISCWHYTSGTDIDYRGRVDFTGVNILNGTAGGSGLYYWLDGSTITSPERTGAFDFADCQFNLGPSGNAVFEGITFKNKNATHAPMILSLNTPTTQEFIDCVFTGNTSSVHGGGIMVSGWGNTVILSGTTFSDNQAAQGSAVRFENGPLLSVTDCLCSNCTLGGTFRLLRTAKGEFTRLTITDTTRYTAFSLYGGCNITFDSCSMPYGDVSGTDGYTLAGDALQNYQLLTWKNSNSVISIVVYGSNRFVAGSTITTTYACYTRDDAPFGNFSIGTLSEDGTVYTVGGTATFVYPGGSTVLSGMGTHVNADGTNDFSAPVHVTTSATEGTGSLPYALANASKWILVDRGVTGTFASTAVALNGKQIVDASGMLIAGGTFTLAGGTVIEATRTIQGSTVTLPDTGAVIVGMRDSVLDLSEGCLQPTANTGKMHKIQNITLSGGTTGNGGRTSMGINVQGCTASFEYVTFSDMYTTDANWSFIVRGTVNSTLILNNCIFKNNYNGTSIASAIQVQNAATISNCTFAKHNTNSYRAIYCGGGLTKMISLNTFASGVVVVEGGTFSLENSSTLDLSSNWGNGGKFAYTTTVAGSNIIFGSPVTITYNLTSGMQTQTTKSMVVSGVTDGRIIYSWGAIEVDRLFPTYVSGGTVTFSGTKVSATYHPLVPLSGSTVNNCAFVSDTAMFLAAGYNGQTSYLTISGLVSFNKPLMAGSSTSYGNVTMLDGSTISFSGVSGAYLFDSGAGTFSIGKNCRCINAAGTSVLLNNGVATTAYTKIAYDGTLS